MGFAATVRGRFSSMVSSLTLALTIVGAMTGTLLPAGCADAGTPGRGESIKWSSEASVSAYASVYAYLYLYLYLYPQL